MKASDFSKYSMLVVVAAGAVVGLALALGSSVVPVFAIMAGMAAVMHMRTTIPEVQQDEVIYKISQQAAKLTITWFGPTCAVAGLLILFAGKWLPPALVVSGYFLSFVALALLVVYFLAYTYYSNKHRKEW